MNQTVELGPGLFEPCFVLWGYLVLWGHLDIVAPSGRRSDTPAIDGSATPAWQRTGAEYGAPSIAPGQRYFVTDAKRHISLA